MTMRRRTTTRKPGEFTSYDEALAYYAEQSQKRNADIAAEVQLYLAERGLIDSALIVDDELLDVLGKHRPKGVSEAQIANIMHGRSLPSHKTHLALAHVFQLKCGDREAPDWEEFNDLFLAARTKRYLDQDG
jgi:hypothetical protein